MIYVLFTFDSSSQAMKGEMALEDGNIKGRLVPLLPEIDAGCGLALRVEKELDMEVSKLDFTYRDKYILEYEDGQRKPKIKAYS